MTNDKDDKDDKLGVLPPSLLFLFLTTVRPTKKPLKGKSWTFGFFVWNVLGGLKMFVLAALGMCLICSFAGEKLPFFKARVQPILLFFNA